VKKNHFFQKPTETKFEKLFKKILTNQSNLKEKNKSNDEGKKELEG